MKTFFYTLAVLLLIQTTIHAQFSAKFDNRHICTCCYSGSSCSGGFYFKPTITFKGGTGKPDSFTYNWKWLGSKPFSGGWYDSPGSALISAYDTANGWLFSFTVSGMDNPLQATYGEEHGYALKVTDMSGHVARDTIYVKYGGCTGCNAFTRPDTYRVIKNFPIFLDPSPCDNESLIKCNEESYAISLACWTYNTIGVLIDEGGYSGKKGGEPSLLYYPKPGFTGIDSLNYYEITGNASSTNTCADTVIKNKIYFIVKDYPHDTTISAGDTISFRHIVSYLRNFALLGASLDMFHPIQLYQDSTTSRILFNHYTWGTDSGKIYVTPTATHKYILNYCEDSSVIIGYNFHGQFSGVSASNTICYSDTFTVHVASTGLSALLMPDLECSLYPSPAANTLNIVLRAVKKKNIDMTVTDETGRLIETKQLIVQPGKQTEHLNTSRYSNGVYYMQLHSAEGSVVKKFVVSR